MLVGNNTDVYYGTSGVACVILVTINLRKKYTHTHCIRSRRRGIALRYEYFVAIITTQRRKKKTSSLLLVYYKTQQRKKIYLLLLLLQL